METVTQGDDSSLNIQNEYFNKARKNHARVTVVLTNGQRISGYIRSFDKFTLILDTRHGDQMVFKHAISTVAPAGQGDREHRGPRPSHGESRGAGSGRPHSGPPRDSGGKPPQGGVRQRAVASPSGKAFGNFMDLSSVSKSAPGGGSDAPAEKEPSGEAGKATREAVQPPAGSGKETQSAGQRPDGDAPKVDKAAKPPAPPAAAESAKPPAPPAAAEPKAEESAKPPAPPAAPAAGEPSKP